MSEPDAHTAGQAGSPVLLRVEGVRKRYPGTLALAGVSLELRAGEVHALVGGNGSGKSTLIKILAGAERADAGTIEFAGHAYRCGQLTGALASQAGLRFVHQEGSTFPDLSVAENLVVTQGYRSRALGRIAWRSVRREVRAVLESFEIEARPEQLLGELGPATQRLVTIARALHDQLPGEQGILVLDEPTASLTVADVTRLLASLRRLVEAGHAILYVTHRLDELHGFADRATVLRDGRVAGHVTGGQMAGDRLVELIAGGPLPPTRPMRLVADKAPERIAIRELRGGPLRGVDLAVRRGEIVGIAGLVGSGRSSLLRIAFGEQPAEAGRILIDGRARVRNGRSAMREGVAYVPEDRLGAAIFPDLTLRENISGASLRSVCRGPWLSLSAERRSTAELTERFGVKAASPDAPFATLSGGNQQKAILARWLCRQPGVLLLDEPTQGVDVRARAEIHRLICDAAAEGTAALVVSADFDELCTLCDRVLVLSRGRISAELAGDELDAQHLERLAYGGVATDAR